MFIAFAPPEPEESSEVIVYYFDLMVLNVPDNRAGLGWMFVTALSLFFSGFRGLGFGSGSRFFSQRLVFFSFAKQECNFGIETEQNSLFAWKRTRKVHESFYVGLMIAEREQRAAFFSTRRQRRSIDCLLQPSPLGNASSEQEEKKLKKENFSIVFWKCGVKTKKTLITHRG